MLRRSLINAVGEDGIAEIAASLAEAAKAGDVAAAKLVLSYTVGQPTDTVDPDWLDHHEHEVNRELREAAESDERSARLRAAFV